MSYDLISPNEVEQMNKEISPIVEYAKSIIVETPEAYGDSTDQLLLIKEKRKFIAEKFRDPKNQALKAHRSICGLEKEVLYPLDQAERIIKPKLIAYQNKQEEKRRAEEIKLQEKARKEQEKIDERARKKAEKAREKGKEEVAEAIENSVPTTPIPTVSSYVPKVSGISTRKVWKVKVVNEKKIPRQYMIPNMPMLSKLAKATKGELEIPGIEFLTEDIMAVGK